MRNRDDDDIDLDQPSRISKSAQKSLLKGIQQMADDLVNLSAGELKNFPLEPELRTLIEETRKITAHSARRRQMRYLSKCLNGFDLTLVRKALLLLKSGKNADNDRFHELEVYRDRIVSGGLEVVEEVLVRFPHADAKELARLQSNIKREAEQGAAPTAAKALFRYLRKLSEEASLPTDVIAD